MKTTPEIIIRKYTKILSLLLIAVALLVPFRNQFAITPLTNDSFNNRRPNVSPNGNAVVWVQYQTTGVDCAAYVALQTAN